jgi:sorting nexin-8
MKKFVLLTRACFRVVRGKINPLIEQWQRICILAERVIKRRESAAVRVPPSLRRTYLPAHFVFPLFSSTPSLDVLAAPVGHGPASSTVSLLSGSALSIRTNRSLELDVSDDQADLARLTNVMRVIAEVNERCWRGDECDLCDGVRRGVGHVAEHTQRQSDLLEQRVGSCFPVSKLLTELLTDQLPATLDVRVSEGRRMG